MEVKLLSIASLLAVYQLPACVNPLRQLAMYLLHRELVSEDSDSDSLETIQFHLLNAEDHRLLLSFATSLIEQVPTAKFSQEQRFDPFSVGLTIE